MFRILEGSPTEELQRRLYIGKKIQPMRERTLIEPTSEGAN